VQTVANNKENAMKVLVYQYHGLEGELVTSSGFGGAQRAGHDMVLRSVGKRLRLEQVAAKMKETGLNAAEIKKRLLVVEISPAVVDMLQAKAK